MSWREGSWKVRSGLNPTCPPTQPENQLIHTRTISKYPVSSCHQHKSRSKPKNAISKSPSKKQITTGTEHVKKANDTERGPKNKPEGNTPIKRTALSRTTRALVEAPAPISPQDHIVTPIPARMISAFTSPPIGSLDSVSGKCRRDFVYNSSRGKRNALRHPAVLRVEGWSFPRVFS